MIPKGINTNYVDRGLTPAELVTIATELQTKAPNSIIVAGGDGNLNVVENETIIGKVQLRNDLGFTGLQRLALNK